MAKTEMLRLRITPAELGQWKHPAEEDKAESLSEYVRTAVHSKVMLAARLREQAERDRENARRQRIAIGKLAEREEL